MVPIKFYRKDGCWLCDHAEELLNGQMERHGLAITKIDIASDDELYELYRFDIPVIEFEDGSALNGQIKMKALLRLIDEHKKRGHTGTRG
jgi:hypothetical protein